MVRAFFKKACGSDVIPRKVLLADAYQIGKSHVLVRTSAKATPQGRFFFGFNYLTVEELANLRNTFLAFICGSVEQTVIVPASVLFPKLEEISRDRNGEYKLNIDSDLNIVLKGKKQRLNCQQFINQWGFFDNPPPEASRKTTSSDVEEGMHSILQGRLVEIGNIRGLHTFCPDKKKNFNGKPLGKLANLERCPQLEYAPRYDVLRQIDVMWFRPSLAGDKYVPVCAFEVELSTGTWSGVGRMSTLVDYSDVRLYVVANSEKEYKKVSETLVRKDRYRFLHGRSLGELYSAEKNLTELRRDVGL